ncbi:MAG: sugar-transfer associated ATP-grasp domain-containing protein [Salinigranum sp.]
MGVHGTVKSSYLALNRAVSNNPLLDHKWFAEQEVNTWSHPVSLPLSRRLWLWRRGFTSPCGTLYDFETYGPEAYLSERQRYRLYNAMNGPHRYLIDDKLSQHWMLSDYPENRPTAYGFVDRGRVHGVAGTEFDGGATPVSEWLPGALRDHSRLVLKQLRGMGGKQVLVAAYDDGDGYTLDGDPVTEAELCAEAARLSGYLVTAYVDQHAYADALYPEAANTVRLLTLWDEVAEELHTPIAIHRIGTARSSPVDNWSVGGLSAEIDLETGELGRAAQYPFTGEVSRYGRHPDTGAQIEGASVPHLEAVRSTVERIARENTNIPAIGWDVIVDGSVYRS